MDLPPKKYGIITFAINLRNQFTINAIYDNNKNLAMVSFHGILTHGIKYYQKKPCYSAIHQQNNFIMLSLSVVSMGYQHGINVANSIPFNRSVCCAECGTFLLGERSIFFGGPHGFVSWLCKNQQTIRWLGNSK